MKRVFYLLVIALIFRNILMLVPILPNFFSPVYSDDLYKTLESLYNESQYRQKNPTALIPDHTVFRYAAGAYLRGVDPIYVNSEHTPLGKYFIALSILLFHNDATLILLFVILTGVAVWMLGVKVLKNKFLALVPLALFSSEPLFLDQIRIAPMLDSIQLPFILFSIYFFLIEYPKKRFFITTTLIGIVISTKTLVPGILLVLCFSIFLLLMKLFKSILVLFAYLPISAFILLSSYIKTFLDGYTFADFLGFQKWIFHYQQSKLIYPLSVWRLLLFNQWQSWWGDQRILKSAEWNVLWPVFTMLFFISLGLIAMKKFKPGPTFTLLLIWCITYLCFLSLGVVSPRFLVPVFPVMYIIGVYTVKKFTQK